MRRQDLGCEAPAGCRQMRLRLTLKPQRFAADESLLSTEAASLGERGFRGTTGEDGAVQCVGGRVWARRSRETAYLGLIFKIKKQQVLALAGDSVGWIIVPSTKRL